MVALMNKKKTKINAPVENNLFKNEKINEQIHTLMHANGVIRFPFFFGYKFPFNEAKCSSIFY